MNVILGCLAVFLCVVLFPEKAHAYIDPGTGSLILQALAAGAITVMAFGTKLRHRIKRLFTKKDESRTESSREDKE